MATTPTKTDELSDNGKCGRLSCDNEATTNVELAPGLGAMPACEECAAEVEGKKTTDSPDDSTAATQHE